VGTSARATEPNRLPRNHPSHGHVRKATSDCKSVYVLESTCSLVALRRSARSLKKATSKVVLLDCSGHTGGRRHGSRWASNTP